MNPSSYQMATVRSSPARRSGLFLMLCALALTAGCATYQARPLPDEPALATSLGALRTSAGASKSGPERRRFDVADGLDLTEVGTLAVLNNPDLRAQRARLALAGAQAFAAGLLPDPQLSVGLDKPTGDTAGLVNALSLGLGYDLIPLLTRQSRLDATHRGEDKVRLDLLWQEWQVIQRARMLAVRLGLEQQRLQLLHTMQALYQQRYQRSARALDAGDLTLDVNGTDLTALIDTFSQINQLEQTHNQTRHDFNLLLGLAPEVDVPLAPLTPPAPVDADLVHTRLRQLPRLRPDLLALQAGYASQEASLRAAVLAQFPSLGIGVNRARDTGDVETIGLSVNLTLPLFSGNRGAIAVASATREQLRAEYRARLARTHMDVDRLLRLQALLQRQQQRLRQYLPRLQTLVERARRAYTRGDIQALTFLNMESTWVNKRLEQISLEQTSWENRIALEALLALPGYPAGVPTPAHPVTKEKP